MIEGSQCSTLLPPSACDVPDEYFKDFTYDGRIEVEDSFHYNVYEWPQDNKVGEVHNPWNDEDIEWYRKQHRFSNFQGAYGVFTNLLIDNAIKTYMANQESVSLDFFPLFSKAGYRIIQFFFSLCT